MAINPITGFWEPDRPEFNAQGPFMPMQQIPAFEQMGQQAMGQQATGMDPISFQEKIQANIMRDKQNQVNMMRLSGGLKGLDIGLNRAAESLDPQPEYLNTGAPYKGGPIPPPENPGITQLIQLLMASNRGGWGN